MVEFSIPTNISVVEIAEGGLIVLMLLGGLALLPSNPVAGLVLMGFGIPLGAIQIYEQGIIRF